MLNQIQRILETCGTENEVVPATELYNEGWMLRLVLDWFSRNNTNCHELSSCPKAKWYSEALLPTQFKAIYRKDNLSESHTHADGVIGNFCMSSNINNCKKDFKQVCKENNAKDKKGEFVLCPDALQFVVVEAKMGSNLSKGVSHAPSYNQAARNVACMAEVLKKTNIDDLGNIKLGFYVIAPKERLESELSFKKYTAKEHIWETVKKRVDQYNGRDDYKRKEDWFKERFLSVLESIDIGCLSWEEIIDYIAKEDVAFEKDIKEFYKECLQYNHPSNYKN